MTKRLPNKAHVAPMSKARRTAMVGAAATALFSIAPSLHAGEPVGQSTDLQSAIKAILNVPNRPAAWREKIGTPPGFPRVNAIQIGNADDISVGPDETALEHAEIEQNVTIINSGDLTGGIGIDASTGAIDLNDAVDDVTNTWVSPDFGSYEPLFDNYGNPVYAPGGYQASAATRENTYNQRSTVLTRDPRDSVITIQNSGAISFAGSNGIRANNPAGESITIENSGDIASTQDTVGRSGIFASTESIQQEYTETQTGTGDFVRNAYGQLVAVNAPDQFTFDVHSIDMEYDAGIIDIRNSGDINMGATAAPPAFGGGLFASTGIYTRGDGGTTIVNSGDISVDKWSAGIYVASTATTNISNSGRIDIGNYSSGISFGPSQGSAGDYRLGGDLFIENTGDIRGGVTHEQAEAAGQRAFADGISVFVLNSNNEFYAGRAHVNEIFSRYNEILGSEVYELFDIPNTRLYQTTVINRGHIELGDGAAGVSITPRAGESTAINEGTIIVGDGMSNAFGNSNSPSAGLIQGNFNVQGMGSTTTINREGGIIVTGDDGVGIANYNIGGTSIAINEGTITTGDGVSTLVDDGFSPPFDRMFQSRGILSISAASSFGQFSYARNSGRVTVGELAVGSFVSGQGYSLLEPLSASATNVNEGIISTGDNSSGMFTMGSSALSTNSGTITTGNYDISAFQPHPEYTADEFAQLRYGIATSGIVLSQLVNSGAVTTGDGTIGASARMYYPGSGVAAALLNEEDGVIRSGDRSIGARVSGNYYGAFENAGRISVGNDSIGADVSAGGITLLYGDTTATVIEGVASAVNAGIIETGDNSVGINVNGFHDDAPYSFTALVPDPNNPNYAYYLDISGTADIVGSAYLVNAGTVRVGANSTGVQLSGLAANEAGLHVFNSGTIDAGGTGTALSINADNDLDSYAVNVGTIMGGMQFGAGDDHFINTAMLDNSGRVVSTGNIVMNGSTIDFGAGENLFENDRGVITIAGGNNFIRGADVVMTQGTIEARNNAIGNRLTFDGNLSGDFTFGADFGSAGSDRLFITGDVADGSTMSVVLNTTQQLSGEGTFTVITVDGDTEADAALIAGITGQFADSVQSAEIAFNQATGDFFVTATFGMGHMATSAASATTLAQNWWMQSAGSLGKRDMQKLAGASDSGVSAWGAVFHDESTVLPANVQDMSFDQNLSGLQGGIEWSVETDAGNFGIGPMFSYGNASANQNANLASARGNSTAYGFNANYRFKNGFYVDATWQTMAMQVDFRTPATNAIGQSDAEGDGFNLELGYAHRLKSGLTLAPQLQYASVDVELDDFMSSDGVNTITDVGGKSSLLRAGLSVFKTFATTNGSITPLVDISYLDAMDGDSTLSANGVAFANDTSGSGYRLELGLAGRYKAWDITGQVGLTDTTASEQALSTNFAVRYRW